MVVPSPEEARLINVVEVVERISTAGLLRARRLTEVRDLALRAAILAEAKHIAFDDAAE